jgi:uncharacterized C2H2 Zn-finger protein
MEKFKTPNPPKKVACWFGCGHSDRRDNIRTHMLSRCCAPAQANSDKDFAETLVKFNKKPEVLLPCPACDKTFKSNRLARHLKVVHHINDYKKPVGQLAEEAAVSTSMESSSSARSESDPMEIIDFTDFTEEGAKKPTTKRKRDILTSCPCDGVPFLEQNYLRHKKAVQHREYMWKTWARTFLRTLFQKRLEKYGVRRLAHRKWAADMVIYRIYEEDLHLGRCKVGAVAFPGLEPKRSFDDEELEAMSEPTPVPAQIQEPIQLRSEPLATAPPEPIDVIHQTAEGLLNCPDLVVATKRRFPCPKGDEDLFRKWYPNNGMGNHLENALDVHLESDAKCTPGPRLYKAGQIFHLGFATESRKACEEFIKVHGLGDGEPEGKPIEVREEDIVSDESEEESPHSPNPIVVVPGVPYDLNAYYHSMPLKKGRETPFSVLHARHPSLVAGITPEMDKIADIAPADRSHHSKNRSLGQEKRWEDKRENDELDRVTKDMKP